MISVLRNHDEEGGGGKETGDLSLTKHAPKSRKGKCERKKGAALQRGKPSTKERVDAGKGKKTWMPEARGRRAEKEPD